MDMPAPTFSVRVPLETEVLHEHPNMVTETHYSTEQGIVVEMDVRQQSWSKIFGLARGKQVHWADVRTIDIRELSSMPWPIIYRLTYGDGWYLDGDGKRIYFPLQSYLKGIDLERQCTMPVIRAGVLLAVVAGVGLRCVCWLMKLLFQVDISKSSLDRWVTECAAWLPDARGMALTLHADNPITTAHFDEIFAKGQRPKQCTLVLRDEHGRIFAVQQVKERTEESVKKFLEEIKSWGLSLKAFYVDGCEAYRNAIQAVFPGAVIQYDYFHIIQNIFRKLWKAIVARRKELKAQGESESTPVESQRLLSLAKRIWENRYVFFKHDEKLTEEEQKVLLGLLEDDLFLAKVRGFVKSVWCLFTKSKTEDEALTHLGTLKLQSKEETGSVFTKAIKFLESRFTDMVAYLRHPTFMKRNSLAETGIRCLRRLEQGHDGFRSTEGLDRYVRLYQAIKYCGWKVHRFTPGLGLQPAKGVVLDSCNISMGCGLQ
ncbi:MAG: transposase [Pseudomonadota bacterium]